VKSLFRITNKPGKNSALLLGNGADIAFLLVVLSAFFSIFSTLEEISFFRLISINVLGVAYLLIGIYGFSYVQKRHLILTDGLYFFIQISIAVLVLVLGNDKNSNLTINSLLLLPLVVQSVIILSRSWMLFYNIVIITVYAVILLRLGEGMVLLAANFPIFFTGQIFIVFFTQMAVTEARSREKIERLVNELEEANDHLRDYAFKVEELAITQERNRLAREIHDGLGHYLTSINMQLQAAQAIMDTDPQKAQAGLTTARELTKNALADVRQSVSTLRLPMASNKYLSELIQQHLDSVAHGEVLIHFIPEGEEFQLDPKINWTLLRATQEGVNNALKHAQCENIHITLSFNFDKVELVIQDDGIGTTNYQGGYGLVGLQERVHLLNGSLDIQSDKQEGMRLKIGVPIE
jgi:signal transduction histidine kinase